MCLYKACNKVSCCLFSSWLYVLESLTSILWENVRLNKRRGIKQAETVSIQSRAQTSTAGAQHSAAAMKCPVERAAFWKEHLHALRAGLNNSYFFPFFPLLAWCLLICSLSPGLFTFLPAYLDLTFVLPASLAAAPFQEETSRLERHVSEPNDTARAPHFKWGLAPFLMGKLQRGEPTMCFHFYVFSKVI